MTLTPSLIRAAAWDAANASMRKAGRTAWSREDADVAADTMERLTLACYGLLGDAYPQACIRFQTAEQLERASQTRAISEAKTKAISLAILAKKTDGMTTPEAFDAILGPGTFLRLASDLYDTFRA